MTFRLISLCVLVLIGALYSVSAEAARFFRYVDENGRLVLSHTIPNERVKFGYDIVDQHSRVIQTVPPQLSDEEYARQQAQIKAEEECDEAMRRVRNLYRSIADIDYAESQALLSIDTQLTNTQANLQAIRNQREELEAQAAQIDVSGNAIPTGLLENIESAKTQEQNLIEQIENRQRENLKIKADYEYDRIVFQLETCEDGLPPRPAVAAE